MSSVFGSAVGEAAASQKAAVDKEWEVVERVFNDVVKAKLRPQAQRDSPLINFTPPADLKEKFDIGLREEGAADVDEVVRLCSDVAHHSVKTGNPMFLNQLFKGADPYGQAAGTLLCALNTNAHIYEISPALAVIEQEVIRALVETTGWPEGDGIFVSGGSQANMFGLNLARFTFDKDIKLRGLHDRPRFSIFASYQSHYSVIKAAAFMGFGIDSVVSVKADREGRMIPEELEKSIQAEKAKGHVPLMVWATSGTTILNAFDPLADLSAVAKQHSLWLHVDACIGGPLLLAKNHRHHMEGVELVDSLTWNWHKMLGSPILTSVFLTRHPGLLKECHSAQASYLFMKKKYYDTTYDLGDASVQCGRAADALKVWLMWKARGKAGLEAQIDHAVEAAEYLCEQMKLHPDEFKLVLPHPNASTVCFWVTPPSVRGLDEGSEEYKVKINQAHQDIKERMVKGGLAMLTYQPLEDQGLPNFFRIMLPCNPPFLKEDVHRIIEILIDVSKDL